MKYYNEYVQILKEELRPAMGCTEPIAVSYAASLAKKYLKEEPKIIDVYVSGNILKNVKSVVVPNTKGLRGIKAATSIGVVAGNPDLELQCISKVGDQDIEKCNEYLKNAEINVLLSNSDFIFDIHMFAYNKDNVCEIRIVENHTNVVLIKSNNEIIFKRDITGTKKTDLVDRTILNVCDIVKFADSVNLDDVKELINRQIEYNTRISDEGLKNNYGANIGKTLLASNPNDLNTRLKARAAAGSDARMNGCNMPVMINSGSGNQGMTCSLPVIEYASLKDIEEDKLLRALVLSNLLTIHIKTGIGTLSA